MKIFISQKMNGLTSNEIISRRKEILKKYDGEDIGFISETPPKYADESIWYLGKSIMAMAEADIVVFDEGYEEARGCRIEHEIAKEYGKGIIYYED